MRVPQLFGRRDEPTPPAAPAASAPSAGSVGGAGPQPGGPIISQGSMPFAGLRPLGTGPVNPPGMEEQGFAPLVTQASQSLGGPQIQPIAEMLRRKSPFGALSGGGMQ